MDSDKKRPGYYKDTISLKLMIWLLLSIGITYSLAIIFYPEKFTFKYHAFSHLGKIISSGGKENWISFIITGIGMLVCAWVMLKMTIVHKNNRPSPNSVVYAAFSAITSSGFILMVFPCDIMEVRFLHIIGSAFVFGGLYFLLILRLAAIRFIIGNLLSVLVFVIFNTLIFMYLWKWANNSPDNPLYQKLSLATLIGGLYLTCRVSKIKGERPLRKSDQ